LETVHHTDSDGIFVIPSGPFGVNSLVVPLSGSEVFLVDPAACSFSHDEDEIVSFLREKKLNPAAAVLTHGHFDHVSGLPHLKSIFPQMKILIHEKDSHFLGKNSAESQKIALFQADFSEFLPFVSTLPPADFFLAEGKTLSDFLQISGAEKWRILHTPGHTEGSVCIFNGSQKILLSGDTIFFHSWGRTDFWGGSEEKMQESLRRIYAEIPAGTKIFPGHDKFGFFVEENL
jgi:glyoxylase-like metal-dependent hydrolase (beta-lactamase superfamily II)